MTEAISIKEKDIQNISENLSEKIDKLKTNLLEELEASKESVMFELIADLSMNKNKINKVAKKVRNFRNKKYN